MKNKQITIKQYNKQMEKIIKKKLPVAETLIKMLEYAATVDIVEKTKGNNKK